MRRQHLRRLLAASGVVAVVVMWPGSASAHPLGNFTINTYGGIVVSSGRVSIHYVVDMAEIPTFQEMRSIDSDGDGTVTVTERETWAAARAPAFLSGVSLSVDGRAVSLRVVAASMRLRPGQGGLSILRLDATFAGAVPASGRVEYRDSNYGGGAGWHEITVVGDGVALGGSSVPARSVSDSLRSYPRGLLASPLDIRDATFSFAGGAAARAEAVDGEAGPSDAGAPEATSARPDVEGEAFAGLVARARLTLPAVGLSLLLALGFGAVHAIGPGHGKTLVAGYVVGAGGRARDAVAAAVAVSVMHTASVLSLGLLLVILGPLLPAERVYTWLQLLAGIVAVSLGGILLASRIGRWRRASEGQVEEDHLHESERLRGSGTIPSRRALGALAVSGGILPSPSALVVLLASSALGRLAFGLAIVAAFSVGLAATLVAVSVSAVRARDLLTRWIGRRWTRVGPIAGAMVITIAGGVWVSIAAASFLR